MRRLWVALATTALLAASLPATVLAAAPANDNVADATVLSGLSGSIDGTTFESTDEVGELSYVTWPNGVWYRWTVGRKDVAATFDTCTAAGYDTYLEVFTGIVPSSSWGTKIAWNDDACTGLRSVVSFHATAGETFWIRVSGFAGDEGTFTLTWTTAALVRGTLGVTLTNSRTDPGLCTLVVKGNALLSGQEIDIENGLGNHSYALTLDGRWSETQSVAASAWNRDVATLSLSENLVSSDGITEVIPKFVNRCSQ